LARRLSTKGTNDTKKKATAQRQRWSRTWERSNLTCSLLSSDVSKKGGSLSHPLRFWMPWFRLTIRNCATVLHTDTAWSGYCAGASSTQSMPLTENGIISLARMREPNCGRHWDYDTTAVLESQNRPLKRTLQEFPSLCSPCLVCSKTSQNKVQYRMPHSRLRSAARRLLCGGRRQIDRVWVLTTPSRSVIAAGRVDLTPTAG